MTEETRESYDSGEVVWVKLGSSWWPGEVKNSEELPSDVLVDFKKPPLVIVKFFDEDSYEYVKTWSNIYSYNCERKNEFIKKGMAAYRAKAPHMEKFPQDVLKAEDKVGGNPNILSSPMFLPEKKRNYAAEIFGTPSPKNTSSKKKRSNANKKKDTSHITHRRFLGVDDYRAYICIQYPGKDRTPGNKEDDEVIRINREPEQDFNCHSCSFSTRRLEVMILHTKSHIQGVYLASARKNKQTVRRRKEKLKKSRSSDVVDSDSSSGDSELVRQKKRKPKTQGAKKTKIKKTEEAEPPKKDIRSELLEAWDDTDDEDLDFGLDKTNESEAVPEKSDLTVDESLAVNDTLDKTDAPDESEIKGAESVEEPKSPVQTIEEVLNDVSGEMEVSKPQPTEEQLSTEKLLSTLEDDPTTDVANEKKDKADEEVLKKPDAAEESKQPMDRDMHEAIKSCFDFDEDDEEDGTIVGKATSGRKIPRVIPKTARKKSSDADAEPAKEPPKDKEGDEDMSAAFKELMEITSVPDLPDVQNSLKCEQNFHNIKTIKFPDKPERKDSTEVATKLTNPKKRFVKSFEDFELMQNEIRRREEMDATKHEKYDDPEEATPQPAGSSSKYDSWDDQDSPESNIQLSKLKSKIMSKIIEEAKINAESKNKIMSKMHDARPAEKTYGHRTPRSKILESYRKDKAEETPKNDVSTPEEVPERLRAQKDAVPPKKNRWSRRGSHPKKDRIQMALREPAPVAEIEKLTMEDPATDDNQPSLELEAINDTEKIKDIILGKVTPTPTDDVVPAREVVEEEEADVPAKEVETAEPELTELAPLQIDEAEPALNEEEIVEESQTAIEEKIEESRIDEKIEVDDNLPPVPIDTTEIVTEETAEEIQPSLETTKLDKTVVSEPEINEIVAEEEIKSTETVAEEAIHLKEPIAEKEIQPAETVAEEVKFNETVTEEEIKFNETVTEEEIKFNETVSEEEIKFNETVPEEEIKFNETVTEEEIKFNETVAEEEIKFNETVAEEEIKFNETVAEKEIPLQMEDKTSEKDEVPTAPNDLEPQVDPVVEETPVNDVLTGNNLENTFTVPSNETQTVDSEKSDTETVLIVEQSVEIEETLTMSPIKEADACLPQDAIITPPKKSKKRKISHEDFASTLVQMEPLPEDFAPLEKRVKEGENVEEEVKVASPVPETFETDIKVDSEITLESEQSQDSEIVKEETVVTEQPAEIEEIDKDKKESDLEIKETVEVEEKIEMDNETIAVAAAEVTITEEKVEEDPKDLEPKPPQEIQEPSKEIDIDKTPDSEDHNNELEIHCASSSMDSFKFSIQTNLSILSNKEEMSALALATLSEIKADLESNDDVIPKEKDPEPVPPPLPEPVPPTILEPVPPAVPEQVPPALPEPVPPVLPEQEMVPIEGNLTVVSEKDLADGQVEITSEQVISPKRPVTLSTFSMDFSDSLSDSNSTDTSCDLGKSDFNSKGTEFTPKALTKQMKRMDQKKESTYGRLELINILEGNSDTEKKPKEYPLPPKKLSAAHDICDFEEHIPSQIVCAKNLKKDVVANLEQDFKEKTSKTSVKSTTSKLLERLTTESKAKATASKHAEPPVVSEPISKPSPKPQNVVVSVPKNLKYLAKTKQAANKPIILSEQIVKPAELPKIKQKKQMEDIEDVEAFVIHKDQNKTNVDEGETTKSKTATAKTAGKAKILQQTIITPAGEIIQPTVSEAQVDDNIFDINSMPIVLSDQILTPESIEKMPIVIGGDTKVTVAEKAPKRSTTARIVTTPAPPNKPVTITKHKPPRILQTFSNKAKNSPLLPNTAKPGKYIIVPQSSIPPTKYLAAKKPPATKKPVVPSGIVQKVPNIAPEPSGNKIMIVTNQQGQQQRLLLTPAQQKMLGYQNQKVTTKTIVKGNVMQKSVLATKGEAGTSGVVSKTPTIIGQKVMMGTSGAVQGLMTTTGHQIMGVQGRTSKAAVKRSAIGAQKLGVSAPKPQKTILIKNQHGQTVRKIQGTDDELLDKQVAEQLKAIKASSGMKFGSHQKLVEPEKIIPKAPTRRSYSKRMEVKPKGVPALAALHHSSPKQETVTMASPVAPKKPETIETKPPPALLTEETKTQQTDRPLNQLVIQDAVGNQTTITEGQILALPSETVDGQPQSYMLVTLDESGNLTPLNSEALMSLDPNLGLGGDLSNMVLQFDQSGLGDHPQTVIIKPPEVAEPPKPVEPAPVPVPEPSVTTEITETVPEQKIVPVPEIVPQVTQQSTNGDPGQQLIVTGDPIATQKFLESLTEGTTDLANILANAEGNSILIQADGQQILINTNTDNQMLLSMNNDSTNVTENTEGGGNPIFATQPSKNQDILAAALADTDVFQQDHPSSAQSKIGSQLSPNNTLYPMNVSNVLETSLTLSSPIMTPLEVPSTNNKKIPDDEADILTRVPKNVDLPITITDPNISQTVANQQVSQMIANELQTNLDLALPISETTISTAPTEMNSPSYVYSLPALDDSVEMAQKPFNGSMPLLNEDVVEETTKKAEEERKPLDEDVREEKPKVPEGFLGEEEGRFTLGGEMCSSLSEPPPEMFDLPEVNQTPDVPSLRSTPDASDNASKDGDTTDPSQADTSSEGSCEIPLQPQIVTKSLDLSRNLESLKRGLGQEVEGDSKRCKFD